MKVLIIYDKPINDVTYNVDDRFIKDLCYGLKDEFDIYLAVPSGKLKGINVINKTELELLNYDLEFDIINSHTTNHFIYLHKDINKLPVISVCHKYFNPIKLNIYPRLVGVTDNMCNDMSLGLQRPYRMIRCSLDSSNYIPCEDKDDYVLFYDNIYDINYYNVVKRICKGERLIVAVNNMNAYLLPTLYNDIILKPNEYLIKSLIRNAKCVITNNNLNIIESTYLNTKVISSNNEYINSELIYSNIDNAITKLKNIDDYNIQTLKESYDTMISKYIDMFYKLDKW